MKHEGPFQDCSPARVEYLERTLCGLSENLVKASHEIASLKAADIRASEIISLNGADLTRLAEENAKLRASEEDLLSRLAVSLNENAKLRALLADVIAVAKQCDDCDGSGREPRPGRASMDACRSCGGVGEVCHAGPELGNIRAALTVKP